MTKPAKAGGSTILTEELADAICLRLMEGESLRAICRDDAMPAKSTVLNWVVKDEAFRAKYQEALFVRADGWAEDIVDISDKPLIGEKTKVREGVTETITGDNVERSKLMADNRKWVMSRMFPKKWGDRIHAEHSNPDGTSMVPVINITVGGEPAK